MLRILLALLLLTGSLPAQTIRWRSQDADIRTLDPKLSPAKISSAKKHQILAYLAPRIRDDGGDSLQDLDGDHPTQFLTAPLGRPGIVYVRGWSGGSANGPLWLVDFVRGEPRLIATMGGWGLGVQRDISHGLHDFIIGSHMSAFETGLAWHQFDGKSYRMISSAIAYSTDDVGTERMAAERARCASAHLNCHLIRYKQPDSVQ